MSPWTVISPAILSIITPPVLPCDFELPSIKEVLLLVCVVSVAPMSPVAVLAPLTSLTNRTSRLNRLLRMAHREIVEIVVEVVKRNQALESSLLFLRVPYLLEFTRETPSKTKCAHRTPTRQLSRQQVSYPHLLKRSQRDI